MPRKTLALISGLVLVTVVLFVVALRAGQQTQQENSNQTQPSSTAEQPSAPVPAHTVLGMTPNPLTVAAGQQGSVDVTIDTSDNEVTAVQLEIGYDPNYISNVKVVSGPLFPNPVVLIDRDNAQTGRYTYAVGISPSGQPLKGTGAVAKVTFTSKAGKVGDTQLGLLPTSLVTARGVAESVMKSGNGTVITVGAASQGAPATQQQNVQTAPVQQ